MKEYVIYDSVKHKGKWVDLVVTSTTSFDDAKRKFKQTVEDYRYLRATGIDGCVREGGEVVAWYQYHGNAEKWRRVRKPERAPQWLPVIEADAETSPDGRRRHAVF